MAGLSILFAVLASLLWADPGLAAGATGTDDQRRLVTTVYPGSTVSFTVSTQNNLVPSTATPQVFWATIKMLAGDGADLDQREVIILVPPKAPVIG